MSDQWYDDQFKFRQTDPTLWWITALELQRAAAKIWEGYEETQAEYSKDSDAFHKREQTEGINVGLGLSRPYFLLMAMAIENLAKGILIGRGSDWISRQKGLSHDVLQYVKECGIALEAEQEKLLSQMKPIIEWHGRYPIPKKLDGWKLKRPNGMEAIVPGQIAPVDKSKVEELFAMLNDILAEERGDKNE